MQVGNLMPGAVSQGSRLTAHTNLYGHASGVFEGRWLFAGEGGDGRRLLILFLPFRGVTAGERTLSG